MQSRCVRYIKRAHHIISPIHPPPRVLVHLYYVAIKGRLASRTLPAGCLFTFPRMDPCFLPQSSSTVVRQGRGVLAGFRVDSCAAVVTAAAATNTMLHRAASYMYTYLSLNQKKSDPRFIMPIIFLRTNLNLLRRLFGNTNLKRLTAKTVVV